MIPFLKKSHLVIFLLLLVILSSCNEVNFPGNDYDKNEKTPDDTYDNGFVIFAPTNLQISGVDTTANTIDLIWLDNSNNEESFIIERSNSLNFNNATLIEVAANSTSYTDTVLGGDIYFYRVMAKMSDNNSAYSNIVYQVLELQIRIIFYLGVRTGGNDVHAIWAENTSYSFHQPMRLGSKVLTGGIIGIGLAYWQFKYNMFHNNDIPDEVDAVTMATPSGDPDGTGPLKSGDFITEAVLKTSTPAQFTVYFEYNHSWDYNDWFLSSFMDPVGQPSVLYGVNIDLTNPTNIYNMSFRGWTPDISFTNGNSYNLPVLSAGELCTEIRYLTHEKDQGPPVGFGDEITNPNSNENAINTVGSIVVEIIR